MENKWKRPVSHSNIKDLNWIQEIAFWQCIEMAHYLVWRYLETIDSHLSLLPESWPYLGNSLMTDQVPFLLAL